MKKRIKRLVVLLLVAAFTVVGCGVEIEVESQKEVEYSDLVKIDQIARKMASAVKETGVSESLSGMLYDGSGQKNSNPTELEKKVYDSNKDFDGLKSDVAEGCSVFYHVSMEENDKYVEVAASTTGIDAPVQSTQIKESDDYTYFNASYAID